MATAGLARLESAARPATDEIATAHDEIRRVEHAIRNLPLRRNLVGSKDNTHQLRETLEAISTWRRWAAGELVDRPSAVNALDALDNSPDISDRVASILDLGCGTGETGRRMLEHHPGAKLVGVDSSPDMLSVEPRAPPDATSVQSSPSPSTTRSVGFRTPAWTPRSSRPKPTWRSRSPPPTERGPDRQRPRHPRNYPPVTISRNELTPHCPSWKPDNRSDAAQWATETARRAGALLCASGGDPASTSRSVPVLSRLGDRAVPSAATGR